MTASKTSFDPTDTTVADAFTSYARAHESGCPITRGDSHGGFWMVVGAQAARTVLTDHERFRSGDGVLFPAADMPRTLPLEFDPPEHGPLRKIFSDALSTSKVRAAEPLIRQRIDALIDKFATRGHADLSSEFAGPLTLQTIADLIGVPEDSLSEMERVSREFLQAVDAGDLGSSPAFAEFAGFAVELIATRLGEPRDDTLTVIAQAAADGHELDAQRAVAYFTGFLIAGHDTTRASLSRLLHLVGGDAALKDRLISDPALTSRTIEESLRLRPPFHYFRRTVGETMQFEGVTLQKGDPVLVSFAAANRDPATYGNCPNAPDPDRADLRHLTFGHGIHLCAGATLARTQLRLALTRMLKRLPDFAPSDTNSSEETPLRVVDSMTELPMTFTPEQSMPARSG